MATEKVTPMVLKVDLQCSCCYKKIKKTLCKFPLMEYYLRLWTREIRDQVYDEKTNTVAITVVCCSPEKIRDKLYAKGGKVIKSIEMKEPGKPKEPEKKKDAGKPKEPEKTEKPKVVVIDQPKGAEKPKEAAEKPKSDGKGDKPKSNGAPPAEKPAAEKPKEAQKAQSAPVKGPEPIPANGVPSVFPYCGPSYDGYAAGPYYHGYGLPPPPQPCYEGYNGYGHGHAHGYGPYGRVGHVTRCDSCFSEENSQACSIM